MSHSDRKALIDRAHTGLSIAKQCKVLRISRSSIYYQPKEASPETLSLMKRMDELFMLYPFYGSQQMTGHLRREGVSFDKPHNRSLKLAHYVFEMLPNWCPE